MSRVSVSHILPPILSTAIGLRWTRHPSPEAALNAPSPERFSKIGLLHSSAARLPAGSRSASRQVTA